MLVLFGNEILDKIYKIKIAFVTTSSICQGEQVALLWPSIFNKNLEIGFAHQPFKWLNNAKKNAGVICSIIGIRSCSHQTKLIYKNDHIQIVDNINPYLMPGKNIIIKKRSNPISLFPLMSYGNKPVDKGNLILSESEKIDLVTKNPAAKKIIKKLSGSAEFIRGINRWCLWIRDEDLPFACSIPEIKKRIMNVREFRLKSKKKATVEISKTPHKFGEIRYEGSGSIIIPAVSSDRREFIPIGFLDKNTIISNSAQAIYNAEPYVFGVISSKMHLVWVKATAGKLKNDYRYSSALNYNTFPFPVLSERQKEIINIHVFNVLSEAEKHAEKPISQLYDPNKMPKGLKEAHRNLDIAIEKSYRSKPFESDEERLEHLFKLYEEMTQNEKKRKNHA